MFVGKRIDEPTLVKIKRNIDFKNHSLNNISHKTLKCEPADDQNTLSKSYVVSLSESDRTWPDLPLVVVDQDSENNNINLTISVFLLLKQIQQLITN